MADNETKPTTKEFAANDQKNYYSGITSIKVNGKNAYELKGKFVDYLHNNAFSGTNGEDAVEHIEYFLRIVDPIDLLNVNHDKLVLVFPNSLVGDAWKWFDEIKGSINSWVDLTAKFFRKYYPLLAHGRDDIKLTNENGSDLEDECLSDVDETAEIFKIEDNLLDYETPLCKAFNEFNYLLKIDTDLFIFEIQEIKTYRKTYRLKNGMTKWPLCSLDIDEFCNGGELPGMVRVGCMTYFQDYKWYDELTDGKLKEEALTHKARIEESWGKATPRVMKFCEWLKNSFENFKELDYDVLVKLEECWWKKDYDPNLDNNANNAGDTQDTKKERHDPLVCNIRRFEMVKYSFKDDEENGYSRKEQKESQKQTNPSTEWKGQSQKSSQYEDEDEEDEEEEEHLALAKSVIVVPVDEHVFPPEGTEPVIPPPSTDITVAVRIIVWPQTSISLRHQRQRAQIRGSSRYEVRESSTARPTKGRGIDYGFVSMVDAKERRQGIRDVGYGIRDT
ncbi:hypothetical protein Tco_0684618 [Tanacetum coccineum]